MNKDFDQVVDFVRDNLDNPPTIKQLATFCGISESYFHRSFKAKYGMTADALQRLMRLRRAAWQLAFRPQYTITEIAVDAGYESVAAFSKSFRRHGGMSPTQFRACPDWEYWESLATPLAVMRDDNVDMTKKNTTSCRHERIAALTLSGFHHQATAASLGDTLRHFIHWRKQQGVTPPRSRTFNVYFSAPTHGFLDMFIGATNRAGKSLDEGMSNYHLPAMTCLTMPYTGSEAGMGNALANLVENAGGCECHPPFIERIHWYPDVAEHESEFTLFAPVALD